MDKADVMRLLDTERARFDAAVDALGPERMETPLDAAGWTPKVVVAHVTWAEREMVGVLRQRAMVGSDLWGLSQDERNAAVFAQNRYRPLDEALREAREVFTQLRAEIDRLSDDDLNNPQLIADIPPGFTPWRLLSGNTWLHYEEHAPTLAALAEQTHG